MLDLHLRIQTHPLLEFKREEPFVLNFEDQKILAYEGETVGAALYAAGIKSLGYSTIHHRPRGLFCMIGNCSSCLMQVNGIPNTRTCTTLAKPGMVVERQHNHGELKGVSHYEVKSEDLEVEIAVVGTGPAGLKSAICASHLGGDVAVVDENPVLGGQLIKQTHKFFGDEELYAGIRGVDIAKMLGGELRSRRIRQILGGRVVGCFPGKKHILGIAQDDGKFIELHAERVIVATGASENMLAFPNWDLPGVLGAGGVQTMMNVYGIKPGSRALMVGSGNVGLIVAYQMLQAGVQVKMVVEAASSVGGYEVHAAKLRRMGIPVLTSHSIQKALGEDQVEGAIVTKLDENWQPIAGTEQYLDVDLICLAVGLCPSSEILLQAGCESTFMPELGGHVALYDENMETSIKDLYVAGDAAGIEEASSAMMEGEIAGASAAMSLGLKSDKASKRIENARKKLVAIRKSSFGTRAKNAKEKIMQLRMGCP